MDEVIPGVFHWTAKHPNIGMDVDSHLVADCGLALDPILPEGEGPGWLGQDVDRIVLTVRHHRRSAPAFGVPVLAHRSGLHEFEGDDELDVSGFDAGDELAPGVRALAFGRICPDDAVLHIDRGPGALAFGDGIVNYDGIRFVPDHLLGDDPEAIKAELFEGLTPLLDEDFDALLFAHGSPIASGGKVALREFVDSGS